MSVAFILLQQLEKSTNIKYTLQKSPIDSRDHVMITKPTVTIYSVNLSSRCPPVFDQGQMGSCTANATACMHYCLQKKSNEFIPSRLYIYYNSRVLQNDVNRDDGATLRVTIASIVKNGVCHETLWPYNPANLYMKPTSNCYTEGATRRISAYASLAIQLAQMKGALQGGFPFVLGILVYSSFVSMSVAMTGNVPIPNPRREQLLGGHAVCVIGYDDSKSAFLVRNSWGSRWGWNGNFWLPYAYATNPNLAFDAWVLYSDNLVASSPNVSVTIPTHQK